jgi:hypothetical protein
MRHWVVPCTGWSMGPWRPWRPWSRGSAERTSKMNVRDSPYNTPFNRPVRPGEANASPEDNSK